MLLTSSSTPDEYEAVDDRWSLAIGRFMTRFAGIEGVIVQLLALVSNREVCDLVAHSGLEMKRKLLLALAAEGKVGSAHLGRLRAFLDKVKKLSGTRNLAAHKGYAFDVYDDPEGAVALRPVLRGSGAKDQPLDIVAFEEVGAEAELVGQEGWALYQDLADTLKAQKKKAAAGQLGGAPMATKGAL